MTKKNKRFGFIIPLLFGLGWTLVVGFLLGWNVKQVATQTVQLGEQEAQAFFELIAAARLWNAGHNGVYVPVTAATPPNPYLNVPDRDIVTTDGRVLTKMNPAYMTREISEIVSPNRTVRFHITSLKPIRPGNKADTWETTALKALAQDPRPQLELVSLPDGRAVFRYMAPMLVEDACLYCHAKQGCKVGDVRGGTSITISAARFLDNQRRHEANLITAYAIIWVLGLIGLVIAAGSLIRKVNELDFERTQAWEQRNLFQTMLVSAPDLISLKNADLNYLSVNPAFSRFMGREDTELVGKSDFDFWPPELAERHAQEEREVISSGRAAVRDEEIPSQEERMWFQVITTPVFGPAGQATGVLSSRRDITQRKRSEEELLKLSMAVSQSPAAVVITDKEGRIEYINPKFTESSGYSLEETIGRNPRIQKSDHHPPEFYQALWQTIIAGEVWRGELLNKKKTGELYWEFASISAIKNKEGEITHFLAVKEDITERKKAEAELYQAKLAAEQANQAKSEFLANMSHEIRTPLNGIIGMTELTLETTLTPEQRGYLNVVNLSADALLALVNDILDFSKIEAGKLDIESVPFQLRDALGDMVGVLAARAHEKGIELAYHVESGVPDGLIGDPGRLQQIVLNLIGNAVKFTEEGEVVLEVKVLFLAEDRADVLFSVRDTGIGIPQDKIEHIFSPFTQADGSTTRKYGGTGLGLTISVKLVRMMGGCIWVESQEGRGSTFCFTVSFGLQKDEVGRIILPAPAELRDLRVLVVDDKSTTRRIIKEMLVSWGVVPTMAENSLEALSALASAAGDGLEYRLIILDGHMPGMDGFQLAEMIKDQAETDYPGMIMLISSGQLEDADRCRKLGLAAYLTKPVRQSELLKVMLTVLNGMEPSLKHHVLEVRPIPPDAKTKLHILLVEDNPVNQRLAVALLCSRGHTTVVSATGLEALAALDKEKFDMVLMDIQMPEMDGFEATQKIREKEKSIGTRLPIIAMTAHAMKGDRERCLDAGMDGYISKPFSALELFKAIEELVPASGGNEKLQTKDQT
ncbi:MAG: response regulator [Deltaproteobacteria bacterium]|nr:response regulator [Deltaproteobacteria bacterium]